MSTILQDKESAMIKNLIFYMAIIFLLAGCIFNSQKPDISMKGTVTFIPVEGGTYGIVADDGKEYSPLNLDQAYQQENLRVEFEANISKQQISIYMWGTAIEIIKIKKIPE